MHKTSTYHTYSLVDSGHGRKLEIFGPCLIARPCAQAVWNPKLPASEWQKEDAIFNRDGDNKWTETGHLPDSWTITVSDIIMMAKYPGKIDAGEMILEGNNAMPLPSGVYARWQHGS